MTLNCHITKAHSRSGQNLDLDGKYSITPCNPSEEKKKSLFFFPFQRDNSFKRKL